MTLIDTTTVGDDLYDPFTELEDLIRDLELGDVFEEVWGIPPAEYDQRLHAEPEKRRPPETEAIAETLDAADERFIMSHISKHGKFHIRVNKPVGTSNIDINEILSPLFDGEIPTAEAFDAGFAVLEAARDYYAEEGLSGEASAVNDAHHWLQEYQGILAEKHGGIPSGNDEPTEDTHSPRFASAEQLSGIMEQFGITGDELKAVLTAEEQQKVLEDYNERVVETKDDAEEVDAFADVPGEIGGEGSYLVANLDRPFISLVQEALEQRDRDYVRIPEGIDPRTGHAYVEV